jgi:hypothetical protein
MRSPYASGMPTPAQLQRLAVEAPEQLVPVVRRATLRTVRWRLVELLRQCQLATFGALEREHRLSSAHSFRPRPRRL